ncbi:MAG: GntR family transcriptional regulator [Bacteroidales bacterium]|nr:GntR family transcriptional regulator [Bacteroidales bacterium]
MEFKETQAIYLQIGDYICENILTGVWKSGNRILSIRELGIHLEVNPNTIMRTYEFLQNQGIIYNKRGIGYYVSEDALEKIRTYRKAIFMKHELPQFLKNLQLLGMGIEDIIPHYRQYIDNHPHINHHET